MSSGVFAESVILETLMHGTTEGEDGVGPCHVGEADACVVGHGYPVPFSIKSLNGDKGGSLALDWSRNDTLAAGADDAAGAAGPTDDAAGAAAPEPATAPARERLTCPVVVSVRKSNQWWKREVHRGAKQDNKVVRAGLYVIDPTWCKEHVLPHLARNNKTNSLIKQDRVAAMLRHAESEGRFIAYPDERRQLMPFSIRRAFGCA